MFVKYLIYASFIETLLGVCEFQLKKL